MRDQAIRLDPARLKSDLAAHLSMMREVDKRKDSFDLIHFHTDLIHFPFFEDFAARTVTTLHGRLDLKDLPEAYRRWPQYPFVSISDAQRCPLAAWFRQTVHHGCRAPVLFGDRESQSGLSRLPWPHIAGETARPGNRRRRQGGLPLDRRQDRSPDRALLSTRSSNRCWTSPASNISVKSATTEMRVPRQRRCAAVSDRLAGAVRPGHDRGDGLRHSRHRLGQWIGVEVIDQGITGYIVNSVEEAVKSVGRVALARA